MKNWKRKITYRKIPKYCIVGIPFKILGLRFWWCKVYKKEYQFLADNKS
jgi:hypothetical protein